MYDQYPFQVNTKKSIKANYNRSYKNRYSVWNRKIFNMTEISDCILQWFWPYINTSKCYKQMELAFEGLKKQKRGYLVLWESTWNRIETQLEKIFPLKSGLIQYELKWSFGRNKSEKGKVIDWWESLYVCACAFVCVCVCVSVWRERKMDEKVDKERWPQKAEKYEKREKITTIKVREREIIVPFKSKEIINQCIFHRIHVHACSTRFSWLCFLSPKLVALQKQYNYRHILFFFFFLFFSLSLE